ncbi:gamma-glutamyl-gamma-aminobutyrate hydrolase family protein [Chloroflexota bacterium]
MTLPLIGITTYRTKNSSGNDILALGENYTQAISKAGGNPVLVPLGLSEGQLHSLTARLDGILFSGGGDLDPAIFGMETRPEVKSVDPDRDRVEVQMVRTAISEGLPFLGICRGLQVINVALGGTLYTHIADQHPQAIKHDYIQGWPRDHLPHSVQIDPNSRLSNIVGNTLLEVNSMHHQGIRDLAASLQPTGWAPDNLIEAIELSDHPFGLAVQWHPECLTAEARMGVCMQALFQAFVEAAAR